MGTDFDAIVHYLQYSIAIQFHQVLNNKQNDKGVGVGFEVICTQYLSDDLSISYDVLTQFKCLLKESTSKNVIVNDIDSITFFYRSLCLSPLIKKETDQTTDYFESSQCAPL